MDIRKIIKRTALAVTSIIVLLIGTAVAIPFFFKDKIMAQIKLEANKQLTAKMDFKDVDISIFRSFPNVSVGLENFSVTGTGRFDNIKLVQMERFDVGLDIMSVIRGDKPMNIKKIWLTNPVIYVRVLEDGTANYNITKSDSTKKTESKPSEFALKLSKYGVTNGMITYDDEKRGAYCEIKGLNHEGTGDFTSNNYDLQTQTTMSALTTAYKSVTYLKNAKVDAELTIGVDNQKSRYTFKDDAIKLNDLDLAFGGWLQMQKDYDMDLHFKSKSADFKSLLSLVPAAYTADYNDVQASGKAAFDGTVRGTYNDNSYPAVLLNISASNAKFKYPKLPMGMDDINAEVHINSPNKVFDNMKVDIPKLHLRLGANPFDATFFLKTPMSDPDIRSTVKGIVNLADFSKAYPVEGLNGGIIKADMHCNTKLSYVSNSQYEKVDMGGTASVSDLSYKSSSYPRIFIKNMQANFTPSAVDIPGFTGTLGKSDVSASGKLDNPLAYFSGTKTMKGILKMASNNFDANEWMGGDKKDAKTESHAVKSTEKPAENTAASKPFDRFDFAFDGTMGTFTYGKYVLKNLAAKGQITPNLFKCDNFQTVFGNSDMKINGEITNIFGYLYGKDVLKGTINFSSAFFDMNQFMTKGDGKEADKKASSKPQNVPVDTANLEPIKVPANIDMTINAAVATLPYDDMTLKNAKGTVIVRDEKAQIKNLTFDAFNGNIAMNGMYDSKVTDKKPKFKFAYNLNKVDFQQAVKFLPSMKKYAPIMQYIDGTFSSALTMDGALKPDLMPELGSLTGLGDLTTINGVFRNFKPLDEVAEKMNIAELKNARVVNTKNWFEIKDGKINIKPFDFKIKEALVNISGTHGLSTEMNYLMKFKVPRAMLEKNAVTAQANRGIDLLGQQAGKLGLNLKQSENIFFNANIGGTMLKPTIKITLVNAEGKNAAVAVVDEVKEKAKAKVEEVKKQGEDLAKAQADKAKAQAQAIADEAKAKAKAAAEKAAKDAMSGKINLDSLKKAGTGILDGAKGKGTDGVKKQADEIKKGVEDIFKNNNPFGKKPN